MNKIFECKVCNRLWRVKRDKIHFSDKICEECGDDGTELELEKENIELKKESIKLREDINNKTAKACRKCSWNPNN